MAPFDPAGAPAIWQAAANTFSINKSYNDISAALSALGVSFPAPAFTAINGTMHAPEWAEWNFQVQQKLSSSLVLTLNYAGNHGVRIPYENDWRNAFDQYGLYAGVAGVPANPAVPNYGVVATVQNGAISNYNGLTSPSPSSSRTASPVTSTTLGRTIWMNSQTGVSSITTLTTPCLHRLIQGASAPTITAIRTMIFGTALVQISFTVLAFASAIDS